MNRYALWLKAFEIATKIKESEVLDWSDKYDALFCPEVSGVLYTLSNMFEGYYDPDTSYEEDFLTLYNACNRIQPKVLELERLLEHHFDT